MYTIPKYAPVFEKDGNRLVLNLMQYGADSAEKAHEIGTAAKVVECIALQMKYTGDVISTDGVESVRVKLGTGIAYCIDGPLFDESGPETGADE